MRFILTTI